MKHYTSSGIRLPGFRSSCRGHHPGPVLPAMAERLSLPTDCQVIASAGHDTAAAVGALVNSTRSRLSLIRYLVVNRRRSGSTHRTADTFRPVFNEAHIDQRQRLNHNAMGLWLLQQSRQAWLEQDLTGIDYQTRRASRSITA